MEREEVGDGGEKKDWERGWVIKVQWLVLVNELGCDS